MVLEKFGKSQSVVRVEDLRFLTGHGAYVDDIAPAGASVAYVLRAPVAHARIAYLDVDAARASDGVHMVVIAADLQMAGVALDMTATTVTNLDGTQGAAPMRPLLAQDRVRFAGEAVAVVIADSLDLARDAAEQIMVDYEELPVHLSLQAGGQPLHAEAPENRAFDWGFGTQEATEVAFSKAVHRVRLRIDDNRVIVNSLEPRGCFAEWDGKRLHLSVNGQGVWNQKNRLVEMLGLDPEQVRVTNPDVGGGFGMKAMTYPEYYVVAHAAIQLGRPVRWMSDRSEAMLSDNAGRDLVSTAELALDSTYKITGYRVHSVCNMGAYNSQYAQPIQTELFSKVLTGPYDIAAAWLHVEGIYTNTTQVDAYRGAGRPEAIYVLERVLDRAARDLGLDPWELRRRNFIPSAAFPYGTVSGETYDVGDFHRLLNRAEQTSDKAGFEHRKTVSAAAGKLRGLGLCYYIESILGDPEESADIRFNEDATVTIFVGTQSNGQGHETVYAQFLADQTGIPADRIGVVQGDSDLIAKGGGTGGSRSVTVQNNATLATVAKMTSAFASYIAGKMGVADDQVRFDDETFRAAGSNMTPSFLAAAEMAREDGRLDLLRHQARATLPARSYPNGAHVAEVEIDPDTGVVTVARYSVVDDFGNLINPMLAEGQVQGGVAQGIGQAITEHVVYDDSGQLLTGSFMDYALPRAADIPLVRFDTEAVPSTANAMGMKGCGEAGTVGALAAVANAVQDALWDHGVRQADMPFTPQRVWEMLNHNSIAAE